MWLRIIKDLIISCEVHDGNPATPYLRHPGTLDEFGRGLLIVGRLVMAWGTRRTHDGKIVWAEVGRPATLPEPLALYARSVPNRLPARLVRKVSQAA